MGHVVQVLTALPGYNAVIVHPGTRQPEFHPVAAWAVLEGHMPDKEHAGGEVIAQGVIPLLVCPERRCRTLELASHLDGYLGIAGPGDSPDAWKQRAEEWSALIDARKDAPPEDDGTPKAKRGWN